MAGIGTKVAVGMLTTGALGGGSYGIYTLTNTSESVEHYLKKHSLVAVSHEDSANEKWEKAFKTYELEKEESELKITDETINNSGNIKNWCKNRLIKTVKSASDLLYRQVARWCTEYTTIREHLKSKTLEDKPATLDGKYNGLPKTIKDQIDRSGITANTHQNGERIKKWCEDNVNRRYSEGDSIYFAAIRDNCFRP